MAEGYSKGFIGFALFLSGVLFFPGCSDPAGTRSDSVWVPRNIWVWRSGADIVNDPAARSEFFTFAGSHGIRTAYVNARAMLLNYGTPSALSTTEANFQIFLNESSSRGMRVHLLVGNGGSYLGAGEAAGDGYPTMTMIALNARNFVSGLSGAKPEAIHWDVEPQQLADFSSNRQLYVQRLVNALQKTRAALSGSGLLQAADIPHWWDDPAVYGNTRCDPSNNLVSPAFISQTGDRCLIRILDQVDIMDYRDSSALAITQANAELSFAAGITNFAGKTPKIVIGLQVAENADPSLTFFDEIRDPSSGVRAMESQVQAIQNQYNSNPAFGGAGNQRNYSPADPASGRYLPAVEAISAGFAIENHEGYGFGGVVGGVVENFP